MTYVIASGCIDKKVRDCVLECPVDAIYEGDRTLYINPDECVDCGACEPVCPRAAIWYEDDLPEPERQFIGIQERFFEQTGANGGASRVGVLGVDEPIVAAWPPVE
ncbi:MAG: ferredoxin family protein [Propionibacteriaceae bacterium]|nr:ferredoxin family protein [Propionibacteriaceae bacterium]